LETSEFRDAFHLITRQMCAIYRRLFIILLHFINRDTTPYLTINSVTIFQMTTSYKVVLSQITCPRFTWDQILKLWAKRLYYFNNVILVIKYILRSHWSTMSIQTQLKPKLITNFSLKFFLNYENVLWIKDENYF